MLAGVAASAFLPTVKLPREQTFSLESARNEDMDGLKRHTNLFMITTVVMVTLTLFARLCRQQVSSVVWWIEAD
jgi:hypothetical protein